MGREEIENYLYLLIAPLLEHDLEQHSDYPKFMDWLLQFFAQYDPLITLNGIQIEQPEKDYPDHIVEAISHLTDKIIANIGSDPMFRYKLHVRIEEAPSIYIPQNQYEVAYAFGPYPYSEDKLLLLAYYKLPYITPIRLAILGTTLGLISTTDPLTIQSGKPTEIALHDCTLWINVHLLDNQLPDGQQFISVRLTECYLYSDTGFITDGLTINIDQPLLGYTITFTCILDENSQNSLSLEHRFAIPNKFILVLKADSSALLQPQLFLEPEFYIEATLAKKNYRADAMAPIAATFHTKYNCIAFVIPHDTTTVLLDRAISSIFALLGESKAEQFTWQLEIISINDLLDASNFIHQPGCGNCQISVKEGFELGWEGIVPHGLEIQQADIRLSSRFLSIDYETIANPITKETLRLWKKQDEITDCAATLLFNKTTAGRYRHYFDIIERSTIEVHITTDLNKPLATDGVPLHINNKALYSQSLTQHTKWTELEPARPQTKLLIKKDTLSFALENALIITGLPTQFYTKCRQSLITGENSGKCTILMPIKKLENILPDPYLSSANISNENLKLTLKTIIYWDIKGKDEFILKLADPAGKEIKITASMDDETYSENILHFPTEHPSQATYFNQLSQVFDSPYQVAYPYSDRTYAERKPFYFTNKNTGGALSTLLLYPGEKVLLDVSGRASQMGVAFTTALTNNEKSNYLILANTGYQKECLYTITENALQTSGRFIRAFTLPQVQWEKTIFEYLSHDRLWQEERNYFPAYGPSTRIASAQNSKVTIAPIPVLKFITTGFNQKEGAAAAAHFALPFGMNGLALFHPFTKVPLTERKTPPNHGNLSYSELKLNQPKFKLKSNQIFEGNYQVKVTSHKLPDPYPEDRNLPDASFFGSTLQLPESIALSINNTFSSILTSKNSTSLFTFLSQNNFKPVQNGDAIKFKNTGQINGHDALLITLKADSILGNPVTDQFNQNMWGTEQIDTLIYDISTDKVRVQFLFEPSKNEKVPLRHIEFSGYGVSLFSNWKDDYATAGKVSQVRFDIVVGRVAHEVVQIKSSIIPYFIPVVRTIIIERKNHGKIIRKDTGWVATGPGKFNDNYDIHPGTVAGSYNVTSIKDTAIALPQQMADGTMAQMAAVFFNGDIKIENIIKGHKNGSKTSNSPYSLVTAAKQFGYIILGNPGDGTTMEDYFPKEMFHQFISRSDVGTLGGSIDCIMNIAGSDQLMHVTGVKVVSGESVDQEKPVVVVTEGTLQFPAAGSWAIVKRNAAQETRPLQDDEATPLIKYGKLTDTIAKPYYALSDPKDIVKLKSPIKQAALSEDYCLLQNTDTQKLLFPKPNFDASGLEVDEKGIIKGRKSIFFHQPKIADPYSLLKNNTIFPSGEDVLSLGGTEDMVDQLETLAGNGLKFPDVLAEKLESFIPYEVENSSRKLYLVNLESFKIYIDYDGINQAKQKFSVALREQGAGVNEKDLWSVMNENVAIVIELGPFKPLLTVSGHFENKAGGFPEFKNAEIKWGKHSELEKMVEILTILHQLQSMGTDVDDPFKKGLNFSMSNAPDAWNYKCNIEQKIPVIKFPSPTQLANLPGPAPLILEAGLTLGAFFNLSLLPDPNSPVKAGAGIQFGFNGTIQVLMVSLYAATAYGVGTAKLDIFMAVPDAKPTFRFTFGFGATVAVQLPVIGYVSVTRTIAIGSSFDLNSFMLTVGQMLRGVITVAGGLASVSIQVEASGTIASRDTGGKRENKAIVTGIFTLDVTIAFVFSADFSKTFQHEIDLPNS